MQRHNFRGLLLISACVIALVITLGLIDFGPSQVEILTSQVGSLADKLQTTEAKLQTTEARLCRDEIRTSGYVVQLSDTLSDTITAIGAIRKENANLKNGLNLAHRLVYLQGLDISNLRGGLDCVADHVQDLHIEPDFEAMVNATVRVFDINKQGSGSGVFIYDNVVLTAGHVVDACEDFIVEYQGRDYKVLKTYRDPDSDLGMLLTEEIQEACIAQMADAGELHLGQAVFAVGTPLGNLWYMNLTGGIISNTRRNLSVELMGDDPGWSYLVGYDAFGGPGCSGGPVFTADGKLVLLCVMGESREGSGLVMGQPVVELLK